MARSKHGRRGQPKRSTRCRRTTLLADEDSVCNKLGTTSKSVSRSRKHWAEYPSLTGEYHKHGELAHSRYTAFALITFRAVRLLQSSEQAQRKLRVVDGFIEAISSEIEGRKTNHLKFFGEIDSGHATRIKVQESKLKKAMKIRNALGEKREILLLAEIGSMHQDLVSIQQDLESMSQNLEHEERDLYFFPTEESNVTVEHIPQKEDIYHSGTVVNIPKSAGNVLYSAQSIDSRMSLEPVSSLTHQCSDSEYSLLHLLSSQSPSPVIDRPQSPVVAQTHLPYPSTLQKFRGTEQVMTPRCIIPQPPMIPVLPEPAPLSTTRPLQENRCQSLQTKDIDETRDVTNSPCGFVSCKKLPPVPTTLDPIRDAQPSRTTDYSHHSQQQNRPNQPRLLSLPRSPPPVKISNDYADHSDRISRPEIPPSFLGLNNARSRPYSYIYSPSGSPIPQPYRLTPSSGPDGNVHVPPRLISAKTSNDPIAGLPVSETPLGTSIPQPCRPTPSSGSDGSLHSIRSAMTLRRRIGSIWHFIVGLQCWTTPLA
ncbi:hypothetical protein QCA50_015217 [Cerrena zonata]|uniref:Uncharacterized protein n=1 Tax=Cerrena zonata TaxID=2478898 RepID=A0AAW0FQL9_9APHY